MFWGRALHLWPGNHYSTKKCFFVHLLSVQLLSGSHSKKNHILSKNSQICELHVSSYLLTFLFEYDVLQTDCLSHGAFEKMVTVPALAERHTHCDARCSPPQCVCVGLYR